ncbi:MAG: carbohydrate ABC transporter substrate-binding protein [Lachnospiraceae bacterium]|nr:carbohydrate ABC transporter substrate-binding protein [Lachnospiraceae bacterium]
MKKKLLALLLVSAMAASLAACGGSTSGDSGSSSAPAENGGETQEAAASGEGIRLLNGKPEIDTQLKTLAAKYQEETGNVVNVETIGGDTNASDELKKMYQADNMPDIFVIEANQAANWDGLLADMTGEAWTNDTDYELVDPNMGVIGFPYTVEATALAYNAEILEKAGVDPATLTSPAAWTAAVEKIDSMKDELGLTAVFGWCAEPANLGWSSGTHVFAQYLDAGLAQDDTTYIDMLNDGGKIDEARMQNFAAFVGMMNQYSDPALLVDGTYDNQVAGFAAGKYAFVTQGNWINGGVTSSADYTGWGMGFAPYAFEDGIDTIIAGPPSYWTVYSDGNVDAAKAFLQWVSDDSAQDILVNQAGLISPFNDCAFQAADPFAESIMGYMAAGKTSGWHTMLKKDGLQNVTCQVFADYAKGTMDQDAFVKTMAQVISSYYNN